MGEEITLNELVNSLSADNLPDPINYQYYKNLANRKIVINQEISADMLEYAVLPFWEFESDGTGEPVEIILSTVGGSLYDGMLLADILDKAKIPVTIHIASIACSMGALIAMAGFNNPNVRTICHEYSIGLIHSGSMFLEGSSHAIKDTFDFSQEYEEKIKKYILTHTSIDEELYEKIERKELYLDANKMLEYGIVDEII